MKSMNKLKILFDPLVDLENMSTEDTSSIGIIQEKSHSFQNKQTYLFECQLTSIENILTAAEDFFYGQITII